MRLKVKTSAGVQVVTVDEAQTLRAFFEELRTVYGLLGETQTLVGIKNGFPPKNVDIADDTKTVRDAGVQNGDQIIVETAEGAHTNTQEPAGAKKKPEMDTSASSDIPHVYMPEVQKYLILRNIADDNSCMFNALSYAVQGAFAVQELRKLCSEAIAEDPVKYNEVVLGRTNAEYAKWIKKKDSWGGAIELGILSEFLDLSIKCIDIEAGNVINFETSTQTPNFIYLVYAGIHYDILSANSVLSANQSDKNNDESVWSDEESSSRAIHSAAKQLCKLLQSKNYTTNTTTFRVRCLQCYEILVGETGAAKHANSTGHYKFGEVTK